MNGFAHKAHQTIVFTSSTDSSKRKLVISFQVLPKLCFVMNVMWLKICSAVVIDAQKSGFVRAHLNMELD